MGDNAQALSLSNSYMGKRVESRYSSKRGRTSAERCVLPGFNLGVADLDAARSQAYVAEKVSASSCERVRR